MFNPMSLNEFLELAQRNEYVCLTSELPIDFLTPLQAYSVFEDHFGHPVLFEVDGSVSKQGSYQIVAAEALCTLQQQGDVLSQTIGEQSEICTRKIEDIVQDICTRFSAGVEPELQPYITTLLGAVSYEASYSFHDLPLPNNTAEPLIDLKVYSYTVNFFPQQARCLLSYFVKINVNPEQDYVNALSAMRHLAEKLLHFKSQLMNHVDEHYLENFDESEAQSSVSDDVFMNRVKQAQEGIRAGEAFQIVLSRKFSCPMKTTAVNLLQALRQTIHAPYRFVVPFGNSIYVGASPEKLISVDNREMETHPIAGTVRINDFASEDEAKNALLTNRKECAEHMMLVDLARNDLGRVAEIGSVEVRELKIIKAAGHLRHMVSKVIAQLKSDCTTFDAFKSVFPAGTLSGAPKRRAIQLIQQLEQDCRGLYGGAIIQFNAAGNLQSCIAIRMAELKDNILSVRAGAGIVQGSIPFSEAEETREKANTILRVCRVLQSQVMRRAA